MKERCLQSLAILLAGLFSAERSNAVPSEPLPPRAGQDPPTTEAAARAKVNEH